MIPHSMHDVPSLKPLVRIAQSLGIELILFGSAASRIAMLHAAENPPRDLLEIAEHASDVDIAHTGPRSTTEVLRAEIAREIPLSPWLRWSIIDRQEWEDYKTQDAMNLHVPLRRVKLATRQSLSSPQHEAIQMALDGKVQFSWNDAFKVSPRAIHDTEISAVLLYLDAFLDVIALNKIRGRERPPEWDREVAVLALELGLSRLRNMKNEYAARAARRIWYRYAALEMRGAFALAWAQSSWVSDFNPVVDELSRQGYGRTIDAVRSDPKRPFVLSSSLESGGFRLDPVPGADISYGKDANSAFRTSADKITQDGDRVELASRNIVVSAVTGVRVRWGNAPSQPSPTALPQEFAHMSIATDCDLERRTPENLAAIAIGHSPHGSALLPAFAIVSRGPTFGYWRDLPLQKLFPESRTTVRINFAGTLEEVDTVDVFLIGEEKT